MGSEADDSAVRDSRSNGYGSETSFFNAPGEGKYQEEQEEDNNRGEVGYSVDSLASRATSAPSLDDLLPSMDDIARAPRPVDHVEVQLSRPSYVCPSVFPFFFL